jgi:hypothetical protein
MVLDFAAIVLNLKDITKQGSSVWVMISAFCYFMALVTGMACVMQLKEVSEQGGRSTYRAPVFSLIAASMFAAAPAAIRSFAATYFGESVIEPLSSLKQVSGSTGESVRALMQFVSLMGYIFFVQGIFVLKKAGQPERYAQETVGKAFVKLSAGMCAIYMDVTLSVVAGVTGWDISNYVTQ